MALNVNHGLQKCGRYRINSGQTAPSGLTGSAAFDPLRKSSLPANNSYCLSEALGARPLRQRVVRILAT
jgi:hypothetical protein